MVPKQNGKAVEPSVVAVPQMSGAGIVWFVLGA